MNDVETIQGARGWRECSEHNGFWLSPQDNPTCVHPLPDPLADTPEGWWEFGQILRWAEQRGIRWECDEYTTWWAILDASGFGDTFKPKIEGTSDFVTKRTEREDRIAALAEAIRPEKGSDNER